MKNNAKKMTEIRILNLSTPLEHPINANYCSSFLCRLRGLSFYRTIPDHWGCLLVQKRENRIESSIHMLFMFCDLTVVWIDSALIIVDKTLARSWHLSYKPKKPAKFVLELAASHINDFKIGDQLKFEQNKE
jgi:uncharacterized membrane protein (UPF0127 family)